VPRAQDAELVVDAQLVALVDRIRKARRYEADVDGAILDGLGLCPPLK
jgi:hypothetical protein